MADVKLGCHLQALEALAKLKKEKTQEAKDLRLKLENLRTLRDAAQKLRVAISQGTSQDKEHMQKIQDFEDQMQVDVLANMCCWPHDTAHQKLSMHQSKLWGLPGRHRHGQTTAVKTAL